MARKVQFISAGLVLLAAVWYLQRARSVRPSTAAVPQPSHAVVEAVPRAPATTPTATTATVSFAEPAQGVAENSAFLAFRLNSSQVFFPADRSDAFIDDIDWRQIEKLPDLGKPVGEHGPEGVWVANDDLVYAHQDFFGRAHIGDEWQLRLSSNSTVHAIVKEPVIAEVVGNAVAGFVAEVALPDQAEFRKAKSSCFIIQKDTPDSSPQATAERGQVGESLDWKATPPFRIQVEELLNARMQKELKAMHFSYMDENSDTKYPELKKGFQKWRALDKRLAAGEAKLDYDVRAFQLMPDGIPRLFVRAEWRVDDHLVFCLTDWIRAQPDSLFEELADAGHSELLRMFDGYEPGLDEIGEVVNVFDLTGQGRGEVLMHERGWEGFSVFLLRYTETGPLPANLSFGGSA